ncbi:hypothetical protein GLOIN_2v1613515 [Rhizophagus clarus]|uniref:Uncharacterized protein n=1 Tax=Rhizophagus clarus TaxID=94130 RepID=A0A8H3R0X8_9GLOM|nr:hypothetical protein GLOIN_2v1613515 [Rhizophagus clarus]
MTETSTVNADQVCQANQDCEKCDWSGQPVPPLLVNSTQKNLDAPNSSEKTMVNKLGSPLVIAIAIAVVLVVICILIIVIFFVLRRRKLVESSRGLIPLQLSGSRTSLKKSKRDSRERERSSKKFQHDDDIIGSDDGRKEEEAFEDSYSPAAVGMGTHRPPQRSQTMYGTSTPSTVELSVDYPVPGQHHFMQQEGQHQFMEIGRDDQQRQEEEE